MSGCKNIQLYDTGVQTDYGDKFITMSTCEYSQKNGIMVVVGRKILITLLDTITTQTELVKCYQICIKSIKKMILLMQKR